MKFLSKVGILKESSSHGLEIDGNINISSGKKYKINNVDLSYSDVNAAPSSHVGARGNAHGVATTALSGFMSSSDKTKLDGIAPGANNYQLPVAGTSLGGVKSGTDITVDASGNVSVNNDSHTHDGRYYTETESDAKYLLNTTDSFSGNLTITGKVIVPEIWFNSAEGSANISHNDSNNETLDGYYTSLDSIMFLGDGSTEKIVLKAAAINTTKAVYTSGKVGMQDWSMEQNDSGSLLFVYNG